MSDRNPTQDELQAMAYADGELSPQDREAFEQRLSSEPALLREVAELRELNLLAKRVTPAEPMDFEWRKLNAETLHGDGTRLGLALSGIGALGLLAWIFYAVASSNLTLAPKMFLGLLVLGLSGLFLLVLRARLSTQSLDPYTKVQR